MTTNEQLLELATLEQDGKPVIEDLRESCPVRPLPSERNHAILNPLSSDEGAACGRCQGRGWLPLEPKLAAWVILDHFPSYSVNGAGAWVWLDPMNNGYYGQGDHPWEALTDAAYAALIGNEAPKTVG